MSEHRKKRISFLAVLIFFFGVVSFDMLLAKDVRKDHPRVWLQKKD